MADFNLIINGTDAGAQLQTSQDDFEPVPSLQRAMTGLVRRANEDWTFKKIAKLVIMKLRIIRTFSANRRPYQHMCDVCKTLKLHQNKFLISHHAADRRQQAYALFSADQPRGATRTNSPLGSRRYDLGPLSDIEGRSRLCPFCKLVIYSIGDWKSKSGFERKIQDCRSLMSSLEIAISRDLEKIAVSEEALEILWTEYRTIFRDIKNSEPLRDDDDAGSEHDDEGIVESLASSLAKVEGMRDEIQKLRQGIAENKISLRNTRGEMASLEEAKSATYQQIKASRCHASFQVDGRVVERDDSGRVTLSRPQTRRMRLAWSNEALETSYIVFVAPEPGRNYDADQRHIWESNALFLARSIHGASKIQDRIKSWLNLCCDHHGKVCNVERGDDFRRLTSKAFFGVVDVAEMRLTALPPNGRYIALSYTWGQQSLYTTHKRNIHSHQEVGGLEKLLHFLPKVVRDAIQLVRALGERYLWVDSLCIVQGNAKSWNLNSLVMDLVYGHAYATICAAEGNGAHIGLRGFDPRLRTTVQNIEECAEGLKLTVSHLAETYIEKSKWNTRGWTFQERLLSRRCIIFVGERVFFQCRSTALSEDIIGEQQNAGWSIDLVQAPLQMLLDIGKKGFAVYMECVRLYCRRDLSKRRDILAAFYGMSNLFAKEMGSPLHFGLPTSHFDLALLWSPLAACRRREPDNAVENEEFGTMRFPSWSWCGWSDAAIQYREEIIGGCLANVSQWLNEHTWIRWYVRDGEGDLRPIWNGFDTAAQESNVSVDRRWRGYGYNTAPGADEYGRLIKKEYLEDMSHPLERSLFKRTLSEYPFGIYQASQRISQAQSYLDQPYLQFWTWSAHLRVVQRGSWDGEGLVRCDIEDYSGDWCGTIVLNGQWLDKWYKDHMEEESVHEFIAISEAKNFSEEESDMWTYYVPREREQAEWHLFYILLVSKQGGIFYREGLGKVFKEAFSKSYLPGKEWKEIILG